MSIKRETVEERKALPLASGVLDYFPDALLVVAEVSRVGNEQHHPGEPLHWDKSKSTDEADALLRHLLDRGTIDTDGLRHSGKVAWRALAMLQRELDAEASNESNGMPTVVSWDEAGAMSMDAFMAEWRKSPFCDWLDTGRHVPGCPFYGQLTLPAEDGEPGMPHDGFPGDGPATGGLTLENRGELGPVFRYNGYCMDCGSLEHTLFCVKYGRD